MPLHYQTGQEIRQGDQIRLGSDEGMVEFIVDPAVPSPNAEIAWFLREHGEGVMLRTTLMGSVFTNPASDQDLHFVSRLNESE